MKKNSFLFLSAVALFVTGASAAQNETSSTAVALPTYVVEGERVAPAEQDVHRSLNALRELARAPIAISVELPALKAPVTFEAKALSGTRLAKF
jgi:hypothetical protein